MLIVGDCAGFNQTSEQLQKRCERSCWGIFPLFFSILRTSQNFRIPCASIRSFQVCQFKSVSTSIMWKKMCIICLVTGGVFEMPSRVLLHWISGN